MTRATFAPPEPGADADRLALLRRSQALGLLDDPQLADLSDLAVRLTGACAAGIKVLTDVESTWLARTGTDVASIDAPQSLSRLLVEDPRDLLVADLRTDPRTAHLTLLAGEGFRSCAAVPLAHPTGVVLGAVCALSTARGAFGPEVLPSLHVLARQAWTVIGWSQSRPTLADALRARRTRELVSA